jgi:hypothetical protein
MLVIRESMACLRTGSPNQGIHTDPAQAPVR